MNPYTLIRKTLVMARLVATVLMLLLVIFLIGLLAQAYWGPWGWVLGPLAVATVLFVMAATCLGLYSFGDWWKKREYAFNERRRAAHVDGSHPAP